METPKPPEKSKNGLSALLQMAGGGDNWVKLATIGLIVITGGGNFLETRSASDVNMEEMRRTNQEIHELYDAFKASVDRQKSMQTTLQSIEFKLGQKPSQ